MPMMMPKPQAASRRRNEARAGRHFFGKQARRPDISDKKKGKEKKKQRVVAPCLLCF